MTSRFGQDVGAGLMFAAFGALGLWLARDYQVGTALRMEPGYVPRLLCWGIVGMGVLIALRGVLAGDSPLARWHWRPLLFVLSALIAFRYMIEPVGLVGAAFAIVMLGAFGSREVRIKETFLLAAGLAAGAVALFVHALALPMRVWPEWPTITTHLAVGLLVASGLVIVLHISGLMSRVIARFPALALAAVLALAGAAMLLIGS